MFKGLFVTDLHYTEQPPIMRRDGYGDQVLSKLEFALVEAKEEDREVFFAGDLFHRKSGVSIRELNKMIELLVKYKPMHIILGNHDIQGHNQDLSTRAIGVLVNAGVVDLISDNDSRQFNDGVFVTGSNYHANYEEASPWAFNIDREDCNYHIHMTHALVSDKKLPFDCMDISDISGQISADLIVNGHYHMYWDDKEVGFYNLGSLARIAMDKNTISHKPHYLTVDYNGKADVKVKTMDVKKDVWVSEIKRDTISSDEVEEFAKSIEEMDINSDEDLLKEILKDEDEGVGELVYKYLGE